MQALREESPISRSAGGYSLSREQLHSYCVVMLRIGGSSSRRRRSRSRNSSSGIVVVVQ